VEVHLQLVTPDAAKQMVSLAPGLESLLCKISLIKLKLEAKPTSQRNWYGKKLMGQIPSLIGQLDGLIILYFIL
jgi:hypothetical protein